MANLPHQLATDILRESMPHPVLSRLSALQLAWLTFWVSAIGLAVSERRLRESDSLLIIGGVMLAAALAGAAAYLTAVVPLHRRGTRASWAVFLLITAINLALTSALVILATSAG